VFYALFLRKWWLLILCSDSEAETAAWNKAGYNKLKDGERMLLWHGSRSTNFAGILKQGLRIAPPEGKFLVMIRTNP
jgi:hypothetical protein